MNKASTANINEIIKYIEYKNNLASSIKQKIKK